jgi:hypothetical protein
MMEGETGIQFQAFGGPGDSARGFEPTWQLLQELPESVAGNRHDNQGATPNGLTQIRLGGQVGREGNVREIRGVATLGPDSFQALRVMTPEPNGVVVSSENQRKSCSP